MVLLALALVASMSPVVDYSDPGDFSFVIPADGVYRIEVLGAGGGGGVEVADFEAGGGGGGGAYVAGSVRLAAGTVVEITVGAGGAGAVAGVDGSGTDGEWSYARVPGLVTLTAMGGGKGYGGFTHAGGEGGRPFSAPGAGDVVSFHGGDGSGRRAYRFGIDAFLRGGEGGAAANSTGAGSDGGVGAGRCDWSATAVPGSLPSGAGGFAYYWFADPAYGSCSTTFPQQPADWTTEGLINGRGAGAGGGGMHRSVAGGTGGNGYVRITRLPLPGPPTSLRQSVRTMTSATLTWLPGGSAGTPVTGYRIRTSRDDGATWSGLERGTGASAGWPVPGLTAPGRAAWVRVRTRNVVGTSPWSERLLATTRGRAPVTMTVVDSLGRPVAGGRVRWAMVDGTAAGQHPHGLGADGRVTLPGVPAGPARLIVRARTTQGERIAGRERVRFGMGPVRVMLG